MIVPVKLLLALVLGAVIGSEREAYERFLVGQGTAAKKDTRGSLGVRTFSLITTLGALSGLLYADYFSLFLLINITFMTLLVSYYIIGSIFTKDNGLTTEIAIVFAYLIGLLLVLEVFPIQILLSMTIVLMLILSQKEAVQTAISNIKKFEVRSFISYALIALVILPFLPNTVYRVADIPGIATILNAYGINFEGIMQTELFNPYKLWFIVALITGVEILGYILEKTVGQKKGWLFTSIAGGFVSSTAVTQSLAQKSKTTTAINQLIAAAIFANMTSFFQLFILIASVNSLFLVRSTGFIIAIVLSSLIMGLVFYFQKDMKAETNPNLDDTKKKLDESHKIFSLIPALKFALLFLVIGIASKIALSLFGQGGFIATSALASVTGLDAVTLNLSELVGSTITFRLGVLTLIIINAVNLFAKVFYSYLQGKREFTIKLGLSVLIIVASSFLGLLFV